MATQYRDIILVVVGDSVTLGERAPAPPTPGIADWEAFGARYADVLRSRGRWVWYSNAGVGADNTTLMLARLATDVLVKRPSLVTIMAGINDSWHDSGAGVGAPRVELGTYESNITSMVQQIRAVGGHVILMTPNKLTDASRNTDMLPYVSSMMALAASLDLPLADAYTAVNGTAAWMLDSIHPNGAGHEQIAALLDVTY